MHQSDSSSANPPGLPLSPTVPKRSRRVRNAWLIILLVLSVPVLLLLARHAWLAGKIRTRLAAIGAAGQPVSLAELNKYYPAVTEQSNAAVVYAKAFEIIRKSKALKTLEHLDELPKDQEHLSSEQHDNMKKAVVECREALGLLTTATSVSACRFPVDYRPGWEALLPHLLDLRTCARLLVFHGVLREQEGKIDEATGSVLTILKCADSLEREPDLISLLVQHRIRFAAIDLLRWILSRRQLSHEQLSSLQRAFNIDESPDRLHQALMGDRCMVLAMYDYSPAKIMKIADKTYEGPGLAVFGLYLMKIQGKWKEDELAYLQKVDELKDIIQMDGPARLDRGEQINAQVFRVRRARKIFLTAYVIPSFSKGLNRDAEGRTRERLAQTALAVEQYRLAEAAPPGELSMLVPKYVARLPADPFSDGSVRYKKQKAGYAVYSVGPDRVDDGAAKSISRILMVTDPKGDIIFSVTR